MNSDIVILSNRRVGGFLIFLVAAVTLTGAAVAGWGAGRGVFVGAVAAALDFFLLSYIAAAWVKNGPAARTRLGRVCAALALKAFIVPAIAFPAVAAGVATPGAAAAGLVAVAIFSPAYITAVAVKRYFKPVWKSLGSA